MSHTYKMYKTVALPVLGHIWRKTIGILHNGMLQCLQLLEVLPMCAIKYVLQYAVCSVREQYSVHNYGMCTTWSSVLGVNRVSIECVVSVMCVVSVECVVQCAVCSVSSHVAVITPSHLAVGARLRALLNCNLLYCPQLHRTVNCTANLHCSVLD